MYKSLQENKLCRLFLLAVVSLISTLGLLQTASADEIVPSPLSVSVDNIIGVYPAPGSTGLDPNNTSVVLKYPATADYDWTNNSFLRIQNLDTGEEVFAIDPAKEHPQQGLKSLSIPLEAGILESGTRYGVTVDYRFAIVGQAPWKSGKIAAGQWTFSTASDSSAKPAPTQRDFSLLTIEGTTPEVLLSNGFEDGIDILDLSSTRGSGEWSSTNAISGQYSADLELGNYGRVTAVHNYKYGADIFAKALQVYAKANIPEGNDPQAILKFCAVAYYFDSGRVDACQEVSGTQTGAVTANVVLELEPTRKVNRVYNWIQFTEQHGPFKVMVDDMHLAMYRVGNNDQPEPDTGGTPVDSDGDGVADSDDAFPNDASESKDSDKDGVGDEADVSQMTHQKQKIAIKMV